MGNMSEKKEGEDKNRDGRRERKLNGRRVVDEGCGRGETGESL